MKNLKQITLSVVLLAVLALFINLFSFSSSPDEEGSDDTKEKTTEQPRRESVPDADVDDRRQYIRDNYKVFSVPAPESLDFAGEAVPLQDIDIKERLDRELIVNTYWHSQTFLFHKRASRWFPIIEPILEENGVPGDFKYLALIESGLDNVVSPAGAAGFWQFMKTTGRSYGLEVNSSIDERYNVELATKAACAYLKKAHRQFGSWTLAAASYNMGMGGVTTRLGEQNVENYYDLLLNNETARYVFRILAAKHILTHSEDFGFNLVETDLYNPYDVKTITVDTTINSLVSFAQAQGINYKILKLLNPWMRVSKLPNSTGKTYTIKLPSDGTNLKPVDQY